MQRCFSARLRLPFLALPCARPLQPLSLARKPRPCFSPAAWSPRHLLAYALAIAALTPLHPSHALRSALQMTKKSLVSSSRTEQFNNRGLGSALVAAAENAILCEILAIREALAAAHKKMAELSAKVEAERAANKAKVAELSAKVQAERAANRAKMDEFTATAEAEIAANEATIAELSAKVDAEEKANSDEFSAIRALVDVLSARMRVLTGSG